MFIKYIKDKDFYYARSKLYFYLNEHNANKISKRKLNKLKKQLANNCSFDLYLRWVLFKWTKENIEISNKFFIRFKKLIKKFEIKINEKEEKFLREFEELLFFKFKPLKEIQTNIKLDKGEKIYFHRKDIILHIISDGEPNQIGRFDILFSNQKILILNDNFKLKLKLSFKDIVNIEQKLQGVLITCNDVIYLLRETNKLVIYTILKRLLNFELKDVNDLYNYFDLINNIIEKIIF